MSRLLASTSETEIERQNTPKSAQKTLCDASNLFRCKQMNANSKKFMNFSTKSCRKMKHFDEQAIRITHLHLILTLTALKKDMLKINKTFAVCIFDIVGMFYMLLLTTLSIFLQKKTLYAETKTRPFKCLPVDTIARCRLLYPLKGRKASI